MNENNNKKFSIKRLIYNDKYLIIVSLILAVVIWIGASLSAGANDETRTIKMSVPITLSDEVSEQLGMQYYSLQQEQDLSVTITGQKYVIGQATENDIKVEFDTSGVQKVGTQSIPIRVSNSSKRLDFEIKDIYPKTIEGYFDVNASKVMELELQYDVDRVAEGYVFGTPVMSEDKIVISGPKTFVDRIDNAVVDIDFDGESGISELYKDNRRIELIGNAIEDSYLTITSRNDTATPINTVNVTIPVLKKTTLPVNLDLVDKPTGLSDNDISISYDVQRIDAGVLESANIKSAVLASLNFKNINVGTQKIEYDVSKLKGLRVLDGTKTIEATISVSDEFERKPVTIDSSMIEIDGLPDGKNAKIESISEANIIIIAPNSESITASDITIKCDLTKIRKSNVYPLEITVDNNKAWVFGDYTAEISVL